MWLGMLYLIHVVIDLCGWWWEDKSPRPPFSKGGKNWVGGGLEFHLRGGIWGGWIEILGEMTGVRALKRKKVDIIAERLKGRFFGR